LKIHFSKSGQFDEISASKLPNTKKNLLNIRSFDQSSTSKMKKTTPFGLPDQDKPGFS